MMLVFFGFYPPIVLQVMSATKDTFFFAFFMVLICLTLDLVKNSSEFFKAPMKVTMWILLMALVTVLRNNCIYAIPFFAIAIWCVVKKKKMLIGAMFLAIFALLVLYKYFIVAPFVTVDVDGREMYSVPAQQLMRIYNSEEANISEKEREVIDKLFVKDEKENTKTVLVLPTKQDVLFRSINNPFKGFSGTKVLAVAEGKGVSLYSKNEITNYTVKYLQRPKPIILKGVNQEVNFTIGNSSESKEITWLPECLHNQILVRAVQIAKTTWQL
jgi:hypothetical protein